MGGFIVTYLDWRWIFYINVPIGLLGLALVTIVHPGHARGDAPTPLRLSSASCCPACRWAACCSASRRPAAARRTSAALALIGAGLASGAAYIAYALRQRTLRRSWTLG